MRKITCEKCGRDISASSISRHINRLCKYLPDDWKDIIQTGKYSVYELSKLWNVSDRTLRTHLDRTGMRQYAKQVHRQQKERCKLCGRKMRSDRINHHLSVICSRLPDDWKDTVKSNKHSLSNLAREWNISYNALHNHIAELNLTIPKVKKINRLKVLPSDNLSNCKNCQILTFPITSNHFRFQTTEQVKVGDYCLWCYTNRNESYVC